MAVNDLKFEVRGLEPIQKVLGNIPSKAAHRIQQRAMRRAAKPLVKATRDSLKEIVYTARTRKERKAEKLVKTRALYKSIGVKQVSKAKALRSGRFLVIIGARNKGKFTSLVGEKRRKPIKYAHLVELGTKRGAKPREFMTKAFRKAAPRAERVLVDELLKGIMEAAKPR